MPYRLATPLCGVKAIGQGFAPCMGVMVGHSRHPLSTLAFTYSATDCLMVRAAGFEPATPWLKARCAANCATPGYGTLFYSAAGALLTETFAGKFCICCSRLS